ncbi:helix-turn-helix domain-containing protein [Streptomyces sp. NPDC101152]|uniref:helix-turn-helix domain-containing protein n=1 Tax=Streptomyces sp. NPDC101152 TaxID=3366116 RepID=UPI003827AD75
MRYAQGGGLTDAERTTRERLRLQAMERFESGQKNAEVAAALRISVRSVERWRRAWGEGGETGVLSKGSPGRPRLNEVQVSRLERELERGPLALGCCHRRQPGYERKPERFLALGNLAAALIGYRRLTKLLRAWAGCAGAGAGQPRRVRERRRTGRSPLGHAPVQVK